MADQLFGTKEPTDTLRRRRPATIAGVTVLGLLAGFGALSFTSLGTHRTVDPAIAATVDAEAKGIASALDANARAAYQRAVDIATTPMVRAAILTDAATVQDMANSEFQFKP